MRRKARKRIALDLDGMKGRMPVGVENKALRQVRDDRIGTESGSGVILGAREVFHRTQTVKRGSESRRSAWPQIRFVTSSGAVKVPGHRRVEQSLRASERRRVWRVRQ